MALSLRYPALYQINTRVWLRMLAGVLGRPATLDDVPDSELDRLAQLGFDWVWLLGVWQTGPAGRQVAISQPDLRQVYDSVLPGWTDDDVCGSCFAVTGYVVCPDLGGDEALARLRRRLSERGLRLMLDFVPNHTGLDHPWAWEHPDYYVAGAQLDLARAPQNYAQVSTSEGKRILAHGRDPYFPGWTDTLQLNYGHPVLQEAVVAELLRVAKMCDGVRCDMAMLILPEVFEHTWGIAMEPFWPMAIGWVRGPFPSFLFMAEVYWDLEGTLLQQGFDYAYDKRLYDRLREQHARPVREHLGARLDTQERLARFLENHDEPRAAATFPPSVHRAAALVTFFTPGLRLLHQGQLEGRQVRLPVQLCRGPEEPDDPALSEYYERLLAALKHPAVRNGQWRFLECIPAWEGDWTWDCFIAFAWQGANGRSLLAAVNYASNQSQCYVRWPFAALSGQTVRSEKTVRLSDLLGPAVYERRDSDLQAHGLYLDLPAWGYHLFEVTAI
jgi:hypothetical protein